MRSVYVLPALPFTAAAVGFIFLLAMRFRRLRWVALSIYSISIPTLAFLAYRFWDHYVGPDTFSIWQFKITPASISFLFPLAVLSPLLLWAAERKGPVGKRENAASALACFGLAATLAAVMCDHLFLLAGLFTLATWCMVVAVVLHGRKAGRLLPFIFPLGLADLCLALGVLFFYLSDPTRGLFFPATSLEPSGKLAASCALMLAAALLRLGCIPLHRWMAGMAQGGNDLRLVHVLAVDLTLGTFLLFSVSRLFFVWDGVWVWVCLGIAALTLAEVVRELLHASCREEGWGLLCAACGAGIALVAAPGGQSAAAAARLGLWAVLPALALVESGSRLGAGRGWARVAGSASLMGIPPLAGFAWLWMGLTSLAGEFEGGATVVFLAAALLLFVGALVMGTVSLFLPRDAEARGSAKAAFAAAILLLAFCVAVGLYPGAMVDLLMREYGLPLDIPFTSWTTLGWAMVICAALAVIVASALTRHGWEGRMGAIPPMRSLPLLRRKAPFPYPLLEKRRFRGALVLGEILIYLAWIATMVYLGIK